MDKELKGLVIRTADVKESDRIITIFTEEMGVISALARGARSLKSRKMSSTMQFCYSKFVLSKRGEYYYIKESELIENFFNIRSSIEGLALAGYIAEILSDVTVAEAEKNLLRLSLNSLYAIASGRYPTDRVKAAFEIRAAAILGFMPDVISCTHCGSKDGYFYFDIMGGAIICSECKSGFDSAEQPLSDPHESTVITRLSPTARVALEYCIHCPLEKIFSFNIPSEDMELFASATELYFLNQMERGYKTLDFYKQVMYKIDL